jgi:hypothetical protein
MGQLFRRSAVTIVAGLVGATFVWTSAIAQSEPPARVGRLAFTEGTVSFHDPEQGGWTRAVVNTPLTTGNSLWTEPNARSEISLAGTRIRMDSATQLDLLALDDTQTRVQLAQGRIDLKTFAMDANQPYEIVTPRGTIALQQQGDYYVEAGSTQDPTRLGVRSGAAQIQGLNGQVLAVRPGEVGEVLGDANAPQFRTIRTAPPAPPAYWAGRDRQVAYDPPQYLPAGVTGYEDLNAYGSWTDDGSYGRVWVPRAVPSGWAPYRTGHWSYVQPWGWTWIDEQPWGFAPYHYGRWANSNNRWVWVPPERESRPVYAPALVAFVGGVELAAVLPNQRSAPVGWFPLGPREVYVPSYTTNRDYYQRLNRSARIEDRILEDRWQRAERREAFVAGRDQALMNQRFATVVPTAAFVRSQPVMRSALQVQPQALASAPVAPVAAPPAPTVSVVSANAAPATVTPPAATGTPATPQSRAATAPVTDPKAGANVPLAKTAVADMPTLARPAATERRAAPGPKVAATQPQAGTDDKARQIAPALAPRQGAAPPVLRGAVTPVPTQPAKPGEPARQQQAAPQPQAIPPAAPATGPAPQARPGVAKPAEPTRQQSSPAPPPLPAPQQARPTEPARQPQAAPAPAPQPQQARPEPPRQPQAAPPPVRAAPSPRQQEGRGQPAPAVEPPRPQATPPQQRQATPPPQQQVAPQQQQRQAAPPPQPAPQQRQAAPPPQQQAAPPPQQRQAPQPAQQQVAPQQQRQAPPPQQQVAPPQQQRQAAPPPQPRPPEQAQSRPAPQPQQQPQSRPAPQQKPDDKK